MCGVAALLLGDASKRACGQLIDASYLLQHRGQDACGIVTSDHQTNSYLHRATGLVTNVFATPQSAEKLKGHMGMAHCKSIKEDPHYAFSQTFDLTVLFHLIVRYPTTNSYGATEAQPITSKAVPGIYIAHASAIPDSKLNYVRLIILTVKLEWEPPQCTGGS
jgi:amidophosphoribosyltransferase